MSPEVPVSAGNQKSLEPTPEASLILFRRELVFARAMARPTPVTLSLLVLIVVIHLFFIGLTALLNPTIMGEQPWIAMEQFNLEGILILFGSKHNDSILIDGHYWRLISSMFLHGGLIHLLMNGYALYVLGPILERLMGSERFWVLYLFAGLSGAVGSLLFTPNNSVGASGAIFGLLAAAVVFGLRHGAALPARVRRVLTMGLLPWVVLNIVFGFSFEQIDNAAHIGGLLGGGMATLVLGSQLTDRGSHRSFVLRFSSVLGLFALITTLICWGLYLGGCLGDSEVFNYCIKELN
jgi:membrane associated rhomboid family serine protease